MNCVAFLIPVRIASSDSIGREQNQELRGNHDFSTLTLSGQRTDHARHFLISESIFGHKRDTRMSNRKHRWITILGIASGFSSRTPRRRSYVE